MLLAGLSPAGAEESVLRIAVVLSRDAPPRIVPAGLVPEMERRRLSARRASIAGLDMTQPQIMGILNVTPDSFSDGGKHADVEAGRAAALKMAADGATIIDVGGESTRPGAAEVTEADEIARTAPVIAAIRADSSVPVSIDTRKATVGLEALEAGADLLNDVSGFTFDPALAPLAAQASVPVCVMHAQGDPATMQDDPQYANVLLDVYDFLEQQIDRLEATGVIREQIVIDPGIGFGKTQEHNLTLLRNLSLFHGLGCPILLGCSRKSFLGALTGREIAEDRVAATAATTALAAFRGVSMVRVHDVTETADLLEVLDAIDGRRHLE